MEYPEVNQLIKLQKDYNLSVESLSTEITDFQQVRFYIGKQSWDVYIDNEYHDFNTDKPLVCIYLVLSALEDYSDADDFLQWCRHLGLNASDQKWLDYFRQLARSYNEIEKILGKIDSFINPLDYQLRSGAFSVLSSL